MSIDVVLPNLGESVAEATISRWLKAIGDEVQADEPLLEISTDKVDTEIPAPASGVLLEIRFNEDDTASVGDVVAVIGIADQAPDMEAHPQYATQVPAEWKLPPNWPPLLPPPIAPIVEQPAVPAPALRRDWTPPADPPALRGYSTAARELIPPPVPSPPLRRAPIPGLDDTGNLPRVRDDVKPELFAASPSDDVKPSLFAASPSGYVTPMVRQMADDLGIDLASVPGSGVGGRIRKQDLLDAVDYHVVPDEPGIELPAAQPDPRRGTTHPLSRVRAAQADMVAQTARVALSVGIEADVTALRARLANPDAYLGDILMAVAATLRSMAELNASVINETVVYHDRENIGLVISTADGPLTPVIHGAGELTAAELNSAAATLEDRAIAGILTPSELAAGTFTVHNGGPSGVAWSIPAINRPQVAALSIGQVSSRPVVVDGRIDSRDIVWLTLSYDRRVIDPDMAASFLSRLREALAR